MGKITIDLTNYKDKVGSRVPPNRYRVLVEDAWEEKAASGNMMVTLSLRILEGEFDGSTIVDRLVLTEKSLFRVVGFMSAIGIPTPKKKLEIDLKRFIGQVLEVDVEDGEPYMGRVKSEVRGYYRVTKAESNGDGGGGGELDGLEEFTTDDAEQGEINLDDVEV